MKNKTYTEYYSQTNETMEDENRAMECLTDESKPIYTGGLISLKDFRNQLVERCMAIASVVETDVEALILLNRMSVFTQ